MVSKVDFYALNKAIADLNRNIEPMMKLLQRETSKASKGINDLDESLSRIDKTSNDFNKRSTALSKTIAKVTKETQKGLQLNKKNLEIYKSYGGTSLEFFAEFLSGTREELRLFGLEAAKVRKTAYGFAPPGTFRAVNKLASTFQLIGGAQRTLREGVDSTNDEYGNLFQTLAKGAKVLGNIATLDRDSIFGKKAAGRLKASRERRKEIKAEINELQNRAKVAKSLGLRDEAAEAEGKIGILRKEFEGRVQGEKRIKRGTIKTGAQNVQNKIGGLLKNLKGIGFIGILKKLGSMAKIVLMVIGKFLLSFIIYGIFILGALFIIIKGIGPSIYTALKETWEVIKQISGPIFLGLMVIKTAFQQIFSSIFGDGDLETLIDGIVNLGIGLLITALSVLGVVLVAALKFTQVLISDLLQRTIDFFKGSASTAKKIAVIAGILAAIVAFIVGAPVLIAAAIGAAIFYVFRKLFPGKGNARAPLLETTGVPAFADGGVVNSPVALVGEKGPELVSLPKGSRVHSNADSQKMMGNTINITVNAKDTSRAEMNRIANEIANIVSSKISRTTNSRVFR